MRVVALPPPGGRRRVPGRQMGGRSGSHQLRGQLHVRGERGAVLLAQRRRRWRRPVATVGGQLAAGAVDAEQLLGGLGDERRRFGRTGRHRLVQLLLLLPNAGGQLM